MLGMNKFTYKLAEAASALSLDETTLTALRDHGLLITYRISKDEYVSDFALRDLQHRLEVGCLGSRNVYGRFRQRTART